MKKMTKPFLFVLMILAIHGRVNAQNLPYECQLDIGVNLSGLADWGTELPFVDLMHNCREWYTRDVDNPNAAWNSEVSQYLSYRPDGYPTHAPQMIAESAYPQRVVTIWAITDGWPAGTYTVLWDGTGKLDFWGTIENFIQTDDYRATFDLPNPINGVVEMIIEESDINDPIHNIRVLMPGTEPTYQSDPFNPTFIHLLKNFESVRFMDWGQTNNWGHTDADIDDASLFDWVDRSQPEYYTWAHAKGIPYEMMILLMNHLDLDGWVCIPHRASNDYITKMATLFRDHLEPDRHLTVEYSNEIWNWIFLQTQWLNLHGCERTGTSWPEGLVPYVQNALDQFSSVFQNEMDRITRAVGAFTGWPDITDRIASNLRTGSFDALSPTFYFGLSEESDIELDNLGDLATADIIAQHALDNIPASMMYILQTKQIADALSVPIQFYEGGQHLTPHPFGVEPTYAQGLLDLQRAPAMYHLYNTWFDTLRSLQEGSQPLKLMHFAFVGQRSAQYGSWGMLETMTQDTSDIPAPKFQSILENKRSKECDVSTAIKPTHAIPIQLFPNPVAHALYFSIDPLKCTEPLRVRIINVEGSIVREENCVYETVQRLSTQDLPPGSYILQITSGPRLVGTGHFVKE